MALNIIFDEFGFLESDSDVGSKLSPMLKQPPISPIESESSSGISSLDSDDLKKQLLSSPPTISNSHDDQDDDDDERESNDANDGMFNEKEDESDDFEDNGKETSIEEVPMPIAPPPVKVIYQNRNILNLGDNIWSSGRFVQYTMLPDNNLSCFFQNRAQYWRLGSSSGSEKHDSLEKCSCCDFCYPSIYHQQLIQNGQYPAKKNAITDSLLTFLKIHHVDFNNTMPNSNDNNNNINSKNINNNINNNNSNIIGNNKQRMYNNNTPYAAYQIMQQQQQQQQYHNNGYHNSTMNGPNQQMSSFNNNGYSGGFNNNNRTSALSALNMMNQSRNVSNAFPQTMNNNSRLYNNNNGLYKQF
ncbi:unnamed protein product [Chironomus riparius]|uniref:Uncharacterized protein n=1 Tax=Chironomus riparius TaxID=315576 RepID=A0A9N9WVX4_9DIPT|nr:unnamed protein product [Chironomus riparius]